MKRRGEPLARGGHRVVGAKEPAGIGIEADGGAGRGERHERRAVLADDGGAGVVVAGPLGHPLEPERGVEAVEVGDARQQAVRMLAHVVAHRAVTELHDGGGERRMADGAGAFARQLTEIAVDDGESGSFGSHEQEPGTATAPGASGDKILRGGARRTSPSLQRTRRDT